MVWPTGKKYEVNLRIDRRPGAETNHEHLDGGESMEKIWPLLFAALAGAAMALQGTMNSALSKTVGLLQATFFVHVLGALVALAAMLTFGKTSSLMRLGSAPPAVMVRWGSGCADHCRSGSQHAEGRRRKSYHRHRCCTASGCIPDRSLRVARDAYCALSADEIGRRIDDCRGGVDHTPSLTICAHCRARLPVLPHWPIH